MRDTEGAVPFYYVLGATVPTGLTQLQARCLWHLLQPKEERQQKETDGESRGTAKLVFVYPGTRVVPRSAPKDKKRRRVLTDRT